MFNNVKYVDPKLYLRFGQPEYNYHLSPTDWKASTDFTEHTNATGEYYQGVLERGLVAYELMESRSFTNTMSYYRSIPFDYTKHTIVNQIDNNMPPVSKNSGSYYTAVFMGFIIIPEDGTYYFSCRGYYNHALCIDNETFLFLNSQSNADGSKELTRGLHKIEFYYSPGSPTYSCYLYWKKPGDSDYTLTKDVFCHRESLDFSDISNSSSEGYPIYDQRFEPVVKISSGTTNNNTAKFFDVQKDVKKDKLLGIVFSDYGEYNKEIETGKSISDAVEFCDEVSNGSVTFTGSSSFRTKFYKFKLLAGVTYTFSRTTDYNDQVWYYNANGTYDNINRDGTGNFTKTFNEDTVGYLEVGGYNRDRYGTTTLSISPLPSITQTRDIFAIPKNIAIKTTSDKIVFFQRSFSYSFWYTKGNSANGVLLSFQSGTDITTTHACLYINDSELFLYNGINHIDICNLDDNLFNKRGLKSPVNIVFCYNFEQGTSYIYVDGVFKRNTVMNGMNFTSLVFGESLLFSYPKAIDGNIKWFRAYDRVLTQEEISSLASEFNHESGDGSSWNIPLGRIPERLEDDTAYIIKEYNDGTVTYINSSSSDVKSFGLFGASQITERNFHNLPNSAQDCPWKNTSGRVILSPLSSDSVFSSSTLGKFYMYGVELMRLTNGTNPMFNFGISSNAGTFVIDSCRFFSSECEIDNSNSVSSSSSWNYNAGRYFLFTGTVGNFIMRNSTVIMTNTRHDAFQIVNCRNATIKNVKVYATTAYEQSNNYNGFCFSFHRRNISGNSSSNYTSYSYRDNQGTDCSLYSINMDNVSMIVRCNENITAPGLLLADNCKRTRISNVQIETNNDLGIPTSSVVCYDGFIVVLGTYDYNINNVNIVMPNSSRVKYYPLVYINTNENEKTVSYTQGVEYYRSISNLNITMADNYSTTNTASERNHSINANNDGEDTNFRLYTVFCLYSYNSSYNSVPYLFNMVKDSSVYAPKSAAVAIMNATGSFDNVTGAVRVDNSRIFIKNLYDNFGYGAINIWRNGHVCIDNLITSKNTGDNMINYYSSSYRLNDIPGDSTVHFGDVSSSVYVKNSNCPVQRAEFRNGDSGDNSSFIYCPNTIVKNGFTYRGMGQLVMPVDVHRIGGHDVSLRLGYREWQSNAFRLPPLPYKGMVYNVLEGNAKMTIHFAEAENRVYGKTYTDWIKEDLWIEVETFDQIYDSRIDGEWSSDSSVWSSDLLNPFKYTLNLTAGEDEKVYVRVYYRMGVRPNCGVFFDPKIDWE